MSRRRTGPGLPVLLVVGALLAVLAACGGHDAPASRDVQVDTAFGRVAVPAAPTRVVALGWGDAEVALALGVQPVGASDWLGFGADRDGVGPWSQGLYTTPPTLLGTTDLDLKQIAALNPDLILDTRDSGEQTRYDALAKIAPTVSMPVGALNFQTTTEQQVELIAQALGRTDQGRTLLTDVDRAYADAAASHPEFAQSTATAAAYSNNGWAVYTGADPRATSLQKLGFEQTAVVQQLPVSPTLVPTTDQTTRLADVMVSFPVFVKPAAIERQAGYQGLQAVRDGHAVVVSNPTLMNAFDDATPAALTWALPRLLPLLVRATPATG